MEALPMWPFEKEGARGGGGYASLSPVALGYSWITLGFEVVGNGRWWGGWGGVSWDEYFFLFGTVYLHWGVVLNSPGVKCDNVIKGLFWCESCNPESTRGSLSSLRSSADRGARVIQADREGAAQ